LGLERGRPGGRPLSHVRGRHTSRRVYMTKEQLERLAELETKVDELRGYL